MPAIVARSVIASRNSDPSENLTNTALSCLRHITRNYDTERNEDNLQAILHVYRLQRCSTVNTEYDLQAKPCASAQIPAILLSHFAVRLA